MRQSAYDGWSRERLLEEVKKLKKRKKYGIVWEHKPEDVVEQCKTQLPVLKEIKSKEIITDPTAPVNLLIEGDNYHALSVLNYTHKGKVDVIYIDPPYNTGAEDWKYNNNYVDNNDSFRHSKWLSMMSSRLSLAKNLLKKDGVMICAIDDNEFGTLSLLLSEIFPGKTQNTVVILNNPHGVARSGFSRSHEYALFLLNPGQTINKKPAPEDIRNINLRRSGNNSLREDSPSMFYPILVDKKSLKIIGVGEVPSKDFHTKQSTIEKKGHYEVWPIDAKGTEKNWYYGRKRVEEKGKEELICKFVNGEVRVSFHHSNNAEQTYKSVWVDSLYDAGSYGATLVKNITGNNFPFPKSINTVYDCLKAVIKSKDAIVLDFFAGSGTTGHAVLMLNKEDGGNRKFILATNNENKIAEEVTYPRIKKTIKGVKGLSDITGFEANLRYFKTGFVAAEPTDASKETLTTNATEMLCVREGTFDPVKQTKSYKIFRGATRHTGIVFDQLALPQFRKELERIKGSWSVYVFSLGDDSFDEEFADLGSRVKVSPVPEAILRVYRRIFSADNNYGA